MTFGLYMAFRLDENRTQNARERGIVLEWFDDVEQYADYLATLTPDERYAMLYGFYQLEQMGAIWLPRLFRLVPDATFQRETLRHAADETRHEKLFAHRYPCGRNAFHSEYAAVKFGRTIRSPRSRRLAIRRRAIPRSVSNPVVSLSLGK